MDFGRHFRKIAEMAGPDSVDTAVGWPKRCSCGRSYGRSEWARLPFVGKASDSQCHIELRNCVCGSTIAMDERELD